MSDISKRSRSIKKKKKKDPKAPKRPRSAYILFCTEHRASVKASNPNDKPSDLMKKMGDQWKNMSDDEKAPYESKAKDDKDRYQSEMSGYSAPDASDDDSEDSAPKRGKKKTKKAKDPNAPKKAMSAYLMFGQTVRNKIKSENPDMKSAEIMKKIAEEWKKLSPTEKKPYEDMARADKQRYENESGTAKSKAKAAPVSDEDEDDDDDDDDGDNGGGGDDDDEDDDEDDDD